MQFKSRKINQPFYDEVQREIDQGRYTMTLVCIDQSQYGQKRTSFQRVGGSVILLNSNRHFQKALVAVDMSLHSLRMLKFLDIFLMKNSSIKPTFLHVLNSKGDSFMHEWEIIQKALNWNGELKVKMVMKSKEGIARTILKECKTKSYSTVIMGKRRPSAVKGWLHGSISSQVLKGLTNESLFLIE